MMAFYSETLTDSASNDTDKLPNMVLEISTRILLGTRGLVFWLLVPARHYASSQRFIDVIGISLIVVSLNFRLAYATITRVLPPDTYLYMTASIFVEVILISSRTRSNRDDFIETRSPCLSFLKPKLFPCRTKHTRLFPTKHSFSYSYLMAGIPVDWSSFHSMLSTDSAPRRDAWFMVYSEDYLARGHHKDGLVGKLRDYLVSQGVAPEQYASAYLITAPRFLGYSFNPISFWYLYDQKNLLSTMILEVNNTFDERRMYFLQQSNGQDPNTTFVSDWSKDFHVSPFNDRDGSYSVTVKDLAHATSEVFVDNNIILKSGEGKAKIVARIFSTKSGIDPISMTMSQRWTFLMNWCWVGFMTNPRILRQALVLWSKKLQVFYRPEVLTSSIGRNESINEAMFEPLFRKLLQFLADRSKHTTISYTPAAGPDNGKLITIRPEMQSMPGSNETILRLRVLTPAFYAEAVRKQSLHQAFEKFCLHSVPGEAMVNFSDTRVLKDLLTYTTGLEHLAPLTRKEKFTGLLRQQSLRFTLASYLGLLPEYQLNLSHFDCVVKSTCSSMTYQEYLSTAIRLLLADRLAFGFMLLFDAYLVLLRLIGWLIVALTISWSYSNYSNHGGIQ